VHRLEAGSQFAILRKKKERKKLKQGENSIFSKDAFRLIEIISQKNVDSTNNLLRSFRFRNI
jgi:hypothetical protein